MLEVADLQVADRRQVERVARGVGDAVARVFLKAFLNAVDQGAGDRIGDVVELGLAGREQEVEQLKRRRVVGKDERDAVC